jgi:hypothetical protein
MEDAAQARQAVDQRQQPLPDNLFSNNIDTQRIQQQLEQILEEK